MTRRRLAILAMLVAVSFLLARIALPEPDAGPAPSAAPPPAAPAQTARHTPGPDRPTPADPSAEEPVDTALPVEDDDEEPGFLRVPGKVFHGPRDMSYVIACGAMVRDEGEGGWVTLERKAGPCRVQGCRATGNLKLCLEPENVQIRAGQTTLADPALPARPLAGLGVNLRTHPEGIAILDVTPDSPADAAGLVPGDVILAIDGASTVDMTLQGFRIRGIGEDGVPATLKVRSEGGDEQTHTLVREALGG